MIRYASDITIDRPIDQTYAFATDPNHYIDWMGDVRESRALTEGPQREGSRYRMKIEKGSRRFDLTFVIRKLSQNALVRYETEPGGPVDWSAQLSFERIGPGATRVTSEGEMHLRGLFRLAEPLMKGEVRAGEAAELVALKAALEGSDADR